MERKNKPEKIEPKKYKPLSNFDVLLKNFPKTKLNLINSFGQIMISDIEIQLNKPNDWLSMPFFYNQLLPRLIPPHQEPNKKGKPGMIG